MALQTTSFPIIPYSQQTYTPDYSNFANLIPNAIKAYNQPIQLKQEREGRASENKLKQINAYLKEKYGEPEAEANLGLTHAQIQSQLAHARHSDALAKAAALRAGGGGGSGSGSGSSGSTSGRKGNPYYGMPPSAKLMLQMQEINDGYLPGSNGQVPLTPEQQADYRGQVEMQMIKLNSDKSTRDRVLLATNLTKSIENTDIDDLVKYSGAKGAAELALEQAKDAVGMSSEDYKKYQEAVTGVTLEAKELRQFLGASITPEMDKQLNFLTNPTSWSKSPETAKKQIQKSRDIIIKQMGTFQNALKSPEAYNYKYSSPAEMSDALNPFSNSGKMITITNRKTGETKQVSYEEAKKMGAIK